MELTASRRSRLFTIVKGVLICMPFFCLAYLKLGQDTGGMDGTLSLHPEAAIAFLSAMLQPYAAYLLALAERRLADGRTQYALAGMSILLAVEAALMSAVGLAGMGLLLCRTCRSEGMGLGAAWRACRPRRLFAEVGGNLLLAPFALLCLFAAIRTGGLL